MNSEFSPIPGRLADLDPFLKERESAFNLKPGTEARIEWNCGSELKKTDYAIVYLHGFRASHPEGDPVHHNVAEHFGYNLYLSRLEEHGIDSKYPLLHLTEEKLLQSARFAFHIGRQIGQQVIIMGTSTGASLALWLASRDEFKDKISALVLYSPLIRFYGIKQQLLRNAVSRKLLRLIPGKKYVIKTKGTTYTEDRIWNKMYALQGALALGAFVERHMQNDTFAHVECPVWTGYYYKNKSEHDQVVSIPAIQRMITNLGTCTELVTVANFPEAKNHVICSSLLSKCVDDVIDHTKNFLKDIGSQGPRKIK
jgi:alpha-beta hydrolase superfamily lysophospholipase